MLSLNESLFSICCLRRHTQLLQQKIDEAYTKMRRLCSSLINQDENSKKSDHFKLSAFDSDVLIEGLQTLFKCSSDSEKVRLLTIAPVSWGRNAIISFFKCTQHQARAIIDLGFMNGTFAFPTSS